MKGLLAKDLLTIKNKYGIKRIIMDICIMATLMIFLKGTGAIYISFLLIPIEIMTMIISLTTCDEQWKWNKYVVALPVSKTTIVKSRYIFAFIMSCVGFVVALAINLITYFCFPQFAFGYYLFIAGASFAVTLLFLSFVLPSNYSLGVNAGFAVMFILVIVLVVLAIWTNVTNNSIMWFVVNNFELSIGIAFVFVIALAFGSYLLSKIFFNKKYN
jgi:ABC-2 type transport system permease protein